VESDSTYTFAARRAPRNGERKTCFGERKFDVFPLDPGVVLRTSYSSSRPLIHHRVVVDTLSAFLNMNLPSLANEVMAPFPKPKIVAWKSRSKALSIESFQPGRLQKPDLPAFMLQYTDLPLQHIQEMWSHAQQATAEMGNTVREARLEAGKQAILTKKEVLAFLMVYVYRPVQKCLPAFDYVGPLRHHLPDSTHVLNNNKRLIRSGIDLEADTIWLGEKDQDCLAVSVENDPEFGKHYYPSMVAKAAKGHIFSYDKPLQSDDSIIVRVRDCAKNG
jgi:hypothetical protein